MKRAIERRTVPLPAHLEKIAAKDADALLHDAEAAIRANDQMGAAAWSTATAN